MHICNSIYYDTRVIDKKKIHTCTLPEGAAVANARALDTKSGFADTEKLDGTRIRATIRGIINKTREDMMYKL